MHAKGTALITGGAGGIGRALASAFAETGYPLILVDKLQDELVRASKEIEHVYSVSVEILSADLTSRDDVDRRLREPISMLSNISTDQNLSKNKESEKKCNLFFKFYPLNFTAPEGLSI